MREYNIFNLTDNDLSTYIKTLKELLEFALNREKLDNLEFNIIFVNNEKIHEINKTYRGIDRITDVISFALEDGEKVSLDHRVLGDIYISIDKAYSQALEYGHSNLREICFLAIHGLLHLLGYDHDTKEKEEVMFKKQEDILNEFGIRR